MLNQKGAAAHILVIIILASGLIGGLVLLNNPAIFNPRASYNNKAAQDDFKDYDVFALTESKPFLYQSVDWGEKKLEFKFAYYDKNYTGGFKVDLSTTKGFNPKNSFPSFGTGSSSPIVVENPHQKWDQIKCGTILYGRISTADGSKKGPVRRLVVGCKEVREGGRSPSPLPSPKLTSANSIGYIGCSNTRDAIEGYHAVSGNKNIFWPAYETGGKSIEKWANLNDPIWTDFDSQVTKFGQPKAVWVNICEVETRPATYETVKAAINNLKTHAPSAKFYISSLNYYEPKGLCYLVGEDGVDDIIIFAKQAVSEGLGVAGPLLGPLTANNTQPDKCHPSTAGEEDPLGKQLINFFDNL